MNLEPFDLESPALPSELLRFGNKQYLTLHTFLSAIPWNDIIACSLFFCVRSTLVQPIYTHSIVAFKFACVCVCVCVCDTLSYE